MKTYTSEAVFLLTTFVNMARSRNANNNDEIKFIDTVAEEIFQVQYTCTYMYFSAFIIHVHVHVIIVRLWFK